METDTLTRMNSTEEREASEKLIRELMAEDEAEAGGTESFEQA